MAYSPTLSRRTVLAAMLAAPALTGRAIAAPRPYKIDGSAATIRFLFNLSGVTQPGTAPLQTADLTIDPEDLEASRADVSADLSRAKTGLFFATEAMKSASVLNTAAYPTARFRSTQVKLGADGRLSNGASLSGMLTLRGVTRPVRFDAGLFRPAGSAPEDLSRLTVRLSGAISRGAFGASGYPGLVEDQVGLEISAKIQAL